MVKPALDRIIIVTLEYFPVKPLSQLIVHDSLMAEMPIPLVANIRCIRF